MMKRKMMRIVKMSHLKRLSNKQSPLLNKLLLNQLNNNNNLPNKHNNKPNQQLNNNNKLRVNQL
jgi:hypothetical protein